MRARPEPPLPGRYGRSPAGVTFELTNVSQRDERGRKQYRLLFLESGVRGTQCWTRDQLLEAGIEWFRRRPRKIAKPPNPADTATGSPVVPSTGDA